VATALGQVLPVGLTMAFGRVTWLAGLLVAAVCCSPCWGGRMLALLIEGGLRKAAMARRRMGPTYEDLGWKGAQALGRAMPRWGCCLPPWVGGLIVGAAPGSGPLAHLWRARPLQSCAGVGG